MDTALTRTGVISGGALNGDIVVNNNDGTVGLLDPTKPDGDPNQFVLIATGGTRGDFVSPDLTNGTLFLSQNEQVARLSCRNRLFDAERLSRTGILSAVILTSGF